MLFNISKRNIRTDRLSQLYDAYSKSLYVIAYRILQNRELAEDTVHDTFISLDRYIDDINTMDIDILAGILSVICHNKAIDICRKRTPLNIDDNLSERISGSVLGNISDPVDMLVNKENIKMLVKAMNSLEPGYSLVFFLRHACGMSREAIADKLDISIDNVKKRLVRAKAMLRQYFDKEGML